MGLLVINFLKPQTTPQTNESKNLNLLLQERNHKLRFLRYISDVG